MTARQISLKEKPIEKVELKKGQQLSGKVIGVKQIDGMKQKVLMDTGKSLTLIIAKNLENSQNLKRGQNVTLKKNVQGLKVEKAQTHSLKLKRD